MLTVLISLSIVLCLIIYLLKTNNNYWKLRGVHQVEPHLLFGNFYNVVAGKSGILDQIRELYLNDRHLPYIGIYAFTKPVLMVNNPDIIKRILVKDFNRFTDRNVYTSEKYDPFGYHSLFITNGNTWRTLRSKISPVFSSGKIKMMFPLIMECGDNMYQLLKRSNNTVIDVKQLTKYYSVDGISSCAFGVNTNCLKYKHSKIFDATEQLLDQSSFIRSFSIFCLFFAPKFVNLFQLTFFDHQAQTYLMHVFKEAFDERKQLNIQRNDLIDFLDQLKQKETINDDYKFDDIKMAAQAILFFTAGNETTSMIIASAIYELALDKSSQTKLREEIRESYERNNGFNYESIQEMKYLDMVINETIRIYPTIAFVTRKALDDYVIEETGFKIDKDTLILIPSIGLNYNPECFPNPQKFDPERFNNENKKHIKPYTFLPFGEGPRNCIGKRFGLLLAKVALVHLFKDFQFDVVEETPIPLKMKPKAIFTQHDGDIRLKVSVV